MKVKKKQTKVPRKLKLYSIGNEGDFNYYSFDKTQKVVEALSKSFKDIFDLYLDLRESYEDKNGNLNYRKIYFKNLSDVHDSLGGYDGKARIDIFYGDKKIFVTINCSAKFRLKFNEELFKYFDMPKPKK